MPDAPTRESLLPTLRRTLDLAAAQAQRVLDHHPGYTPMYTVGGKWNREGERWTHWCEGFFPGILWLLHKHTGDARWRGPAEQLSRALEPRRFDRNVHDLGFLFLSTYLRWFHLTGEPAVRDVLIDAGRTLALRQQKGGYLASFVAPESLFIDIMMNVGIIFWAARATDDAALWQVALDHCRTTARTLVRGDGGTAHEGIFDLATGAFVKQTTHQGWRGDTTWSRGLAWSLYGFTSAYRFTGEREFLDVARANADFWLRRSPPTLVPPWDFDLPADLPPTVDSSAAAIAASGLLDLSEATTDPGEQARYHTAALTILQTLCTDDYVPFHRPEWEGILMHGIYHYHKNLAVDESVAWGEHFFVEALVKAAAGHSAAGW
ncbi:MAG: glycoside hydrolase family 88 protein [Gemmataceae bacterium]